MHVDREGIGSRRRGCLRQAVSILDNFATVNFNLMNFATVNFATMNFTTVNFTPMGTL